MLHKNKVLFVFGIMLNLMLIVLSGCTSESTDNSTKNVFSESSKTEESEQSEMSSFSVTSESLESLESNNIQQIDDAVLETARLDATVLSNACRTVYSGIKSGSITNKSKNYDGSNIEYAPAEGASVEERYNAAENVCIDDVQRYNGTSISYQDLVYVVTEFDGHRVGDIVYSKDPELIGFEDCVQQFDLEYINVANYKNKTTLGELYNES